MALNGESRCREVFGKVEPGSFEPWDTIPMYAMVGSLVRMRNKKLAEEYGLKDVVPNRVQLQVFNMH